MHKIVELNNGIKVIYEKIDYYRSVAIGFWVKTGSIDENEENNGVCHFIEHMLFKGTEHKSAKEIADRIDNLGGELNAFTSKDCTCFYGRVVDQHLYILIDIITDMLMNPLMAEKDIENEKRIILEELSSYEDSPEDLTFDMLTEYMLKNSMLSANIIGTEKSINGLTRQKMLDYMKKYYSSNNIYVSVTGNFDETELIENLNSNIGSLPVGNHNFDEKLPFELAYDTGFKTKDIEQVHFELGFGGLDYNDDRVYAMAALNSIIGSGVSSRLFQQIREDKGLVYSISSSPTQFENAGIYSIYSSVLSENLLEVLSNIKEIVEKLLESGVTQEEFLRSKEQLKGSYVLDLEGTDSIMNHLGKSILFDKVIRSTEEVIAKIDKITIQQVNELIKFIFEDRRYALSLVGNVDQELYEQGLSALWG